MLFPFFLGQGKHFGAINEKLIYRRILESQKDGKETTEMSFRLHEAKYGWTILVDIK